MDEPDKPHAGIDLDLISLSSLNRMERGREFGKLPSDPSDYRVFVNAIFKRMAGEELFFSFSRQMNDVNKILNTQYSSASDIAQVILKDLALTSKMLKLVNSSFYRHFSTRGISTISDAMIILGTDEIRLAAASIKIYETMKGLANTGILAEKALKGLQRGIMAGQIAREGGYKDPDALQISAMLYDLGEYLVVLFDPEKYIKIEIAMDQDQVSRQEASKSILGISYSDLGRIAALKLHVPEKIVHAMRPVTQFDVRADKLSDRDRYRYVTAFTRELCDLSLEGGGHRDQAGRLADKYKGALDMEVSKVLELAHTSWERISKHKALFNMGLDHH